MGGHLREIDILVVPSRGEWTPLVVMEALAHRKPVVAADVGSIGKVIKDGVTGVLVPPNDPQRLASAITDLLADPAAATLMGREAAGSIEADFSLDATLIGVEREIHRLSPRAPRRAS